MCYFGGALVLDGLDVPDPLEPALLELGSLGKLAPFEPAPLVVEGLAMPEPPDVPDPPDIPAPPELAPPWLAPLELVPPELAPPAEAPPGVKFWPDFAAERLCAFRSFTAASPFAVRPFAILP